MIKPIIRSIVRSIATTIVNPDSGGGSVFSPLTASYSSATFSPVLVTNTETISFHVKGLTNSAAAQTVLGSSGTSASLVWRGSDGRIQLITDAGSFRSTNYTPISDGGEYYIELTITPTGYDLYVDDVLRDTATGAINQATFDSVASAMTQGAIFGVTLGGSASWPMQSASDDVFDGEDMIGSNNLTYNGAPGTITSADTIQTTPL